MTQSVLRSIYEENKSKNTHVFQIRFIKSCPEKIFLLFLDIFTTSVCDLIPVKVESVRFFSRESISFLSHFFSSCLHFPFSLHISLIHMSLRSPWIGFKFGMQFKRQRFHGIYFRQHLYSYLSALRCVSSNRHVPSHFITKDRKR